MPINNDNVEKNIARAREFAKKSLEGNVNANKDDYLMFQISKFILLKESMIKKDNDNEHKKIYFNIEENKKYLKAIIYIVDYVRKNGTLKSNNIEVIIEPNSYPNNEELKSYIRDFHKIRDSFAHGGYDPDSANDCIILNNDNIEPECKLDSKGLPVENNPNTYIIRCKLPIEVLEVFTYIFENPTENINKIEADKMKNKIEQIRYKYNYIKDNNDIINNYKLNGFINNYNNINTEYLNNNNITNHKLINNKEINTEYLNNNTINHKLNINKYKNINNDINKIAEEKEIELNKLLKQLLNSNLLSLQEKNIFLDHIKKYISINQKLDLDNSIVKNNKKPTNNYIKKLSIVIKEISTIIGVKSNPEEMIKVSSVYNYMQLVLSFKNEEINHQNKNNLGKIRMSRINPDYSKRTDFKEINTSIKECVKKIIKKLGDRKNIKGEVIKEGKISNYIKNPKIDIREAINNEIKIYYEEILSLLAKRNDKIITSIRNSINHGNIKEENGVLQLHDQIKQNDSSIKTFECSGTPADFYEITRCIDLDEAPDFNFDDFMNEMKGILEKDKYEELKSIIDGILIINRVTLIDTLRNVATRKN